VLKEMSFFCLTATGMSKYFQDYSINTRRYEMDMWPSQEWSPRVNQYCDVDGVSYATASKIHVTADVIIATQRLRVLRLIHAVLEIPKHPNSLKPQQR
jgi:hypothetical protein